MSKRKHLKNSETWVSHSGGQGWRYNWEVMWNSFCIHLLFSGTRCSHTSPVLLYFSHRILRPPTWSPSLQFLAIVTNLTPDYYITLLKTHFQSHHSICSHSFSGSLWLSKERVNSSQHRIPVHPLILLLELPAQLLSQLFPDHAMCFLLLDCSWCSSGLNAPTHISASWSPTNTPRPFWTWPLPWSFFFISSTQILQEPSFYLSLGIYFSSLYYSNLCTWYIPLWCYKLLKPGNRLLIILINSQCTE